MNVDYKQKVTNFLNSTETREEVESQKSNILNDNLTVDDMIVNLISARGGGWNPPLDVFPRHRPKCQQIDFKLSDF